MSNRNTVVFKKSLLAIAVLSLSACSTPQRAQDYGLSQIGEGILSAGRTGADLSQRAWNKTTYLLGFSDSDIPSDENLLMDEVDLALMQDDAAPTTDDTVIRPIVIQRATPAQQTPTNVELVQQDETPINLKDGSTVQTGLLNADEAQSEVTAAKDPTEEITVVEDLIHEVAANETLWDISKDTTGDATNWHLLADVNNLGPNASVFPGQQLIIPGDMLKPGFDASVSDASVSDTQQAAADATSDSQDLSEGQSAETQRLVIPEADTTVVAATTAPAVQLEGRPFKLNQDETLWDFAKRTTGDATNWQAIAGQNDFTEKQALVVRPGQTIYVPEDLVRSELDVAQNTDQTPTKEMETTSASELNVAKNDDKTPINDSDSAINAAVTDSIEPVNVDEEAVSASSQLIAKSSLLDETQPVKIVEATFKADDALPAIELEPTVAKAAPTDADSSEPEEIMVSGTYYPKAVYNDADFSSSLLMRVSPGTTLQVSKAMGNWFEVSTDKGVGYVHLRDIK